MAFVINASGGDPCWMVGSQLLAVPSVESKS
jgi:hypothetical protein